jgi:metallo-beta-lactamase family protein
VLFTGFQAQGTSGGASWTAPSVPLFDERSRCAADHTLGGLSAHADRDALLAWLGRSGAPAPFVVHGEADTRPPSRSSWPSSRWNTLARRAGRASNSSR